MTTNVILASGSPRRRNLLRAADISFEVVESGVEELCGQGEEPGDYALRLASDKALAVSSRYPDALVIGADTIVYCEGELLEKPSSPDDARRMLEKLSANVHVVITAFAIARGGAILEREPVRSRVTFRPLTSGEIADYIASGEPFDKAGAYGIQGHAASFIAHVDTERDNVMGLPTARVVAALRRHGYTG
ncbi:MAG TPA: Maf family protein [Candidatus Binataceae bacterium]|nr:Maf family protein [Candidatus Binataceae bacterium]